MPLADYALVVGIDQYPGLSPLTGAEHDAQRFYDWVTRPDGGGVDKAHAQLILSSAFPAPADDAFAEPTRETIERFFFRIDKAADSNNDEGVGNKAGKRLWLFFSGHGFSPSLDQSAILAANAARKRILNIATRRWADRLYEGGWFDEVILFQDACRESAPTAELSPPFLLRRGAAQNQIRRRFYAFAAADGLLAKEKPLPDGKTGGVFTATLMNALESGARDPETGAVTSDRLKAYLRANMQLLLSTAELADPAIAKAPEFFDPEPFDIVPAPSPAVAAPAMQAFAVRIVSRIAGAEAALFDATLKQLQRVPAIPAVWELALPLGIYKVAITGGAEALFEVKGGIDATGTPIVGVVNV